MSILNLTVPVIGILRGVDADFFRQLVERSFTAGLQAIEVTMNTPNGLEMVEQCRKNITGNHLLGMGTICDVEEAKRAIDAGAMFLVTPSFSEDVISFAGLHGIPVVAGALTPTEIYNAWSAGAAMIKVFPCGAMGGSQYIKDLRGPFNDIPLIAVGGVTLENVKKYFQAGVQGVGVSTALFGKVALLEQRIDDLTENVEKFIAAAQLTQSRID